MGVYIINYLHVRKLPPRRRLFLALIYSNLTVCYFIFPEKEMGSGEQICVLKFVMKRASSSLFIIHNNLFVAVRQQKSLHHEVSISQRRETSFSGKLLARFQ